MTTVDHRRAALPTARWLVPAVELERRVRALQRRLRAADIDLAIVGQNADLGYFSGSILAGWMLVPADGEPVLVVRRALDRVVAETSWTDVRPGVASKHVAAAIDGLGAGRGRVATALDCTPAAEYLKLCELLPGAEIVDVTHHVRSVRAVKSPWELDHHRAAARQVVAAMRSIAAVVRPGWREVDVARHVEDVLRGAGHQGQMRMRRFGGEMFYGQVCAGVNAALPAALDAPLGGAGLYPTCGKGASTDELREGDLLVVDLMGCCNGYLSDCTRVIAIGGTDAVPADLLAAQAWCTELLEELAGLVRPGVRPCDLYAHALARAGEDGHADRFMGARPDQARFVGHGIGLEVDEYPFLATGFDDPLEQGMVVAIEPKLVFARRAAVGIEDAFVVTDRGSDPLPALPRGVIEPNS